MFSFDILFAVFYQYMNSLRTFFISSSALALSLLSVGSASATVTFDLSNVQLQYGGTLTGSFTTNDSFTTVVSYDLVASAGPGAPGFTFPGFTYTSSDSSVTAETKSLIQFDSNPAGEELRLTFQSPLSASTDSLKTNSYESEIVAGNRVVTSGSVSAVAAVPEPASIGLLGAGLVGLIFAGKRRTR